MDDELLYDYYGVSLRTHDDDECTVMMRYHVFDDESALGMGFSLNDMGHVTNDDKNLLIKYAPKLFNTMNREIDLKDTMMNLAVLVHDFRYGYSQIKWVNKNIYKNYPKTYSTHKDDKKVAAFKKHIKIIHDLMGGTVVGTQKGNDLKKILEDAYINSGEYLTKNKKYTLSKDPISDYLISLGLVGKSKKIEEFIEKIAPNSTFQ